MSVALGSAGALFRLDGAQTFVVTYTNWRGETADRRICPLSIFFGSTEWHPEPQWLVEAIDTDTDARKLFALKDMRPVDLA